jgi:transcriptional regulator with XRE-family HTH domain
MPGFDIVVLARRINQRRKEHNRLHPDRPARITSAMSRILENDPGYIPHRERRDGKQQRPSRNPGIATLVRIAAALGTTVGDLLGEPCAPLSPTERAVLARAIYVIRGLIDPDRK